MCGDWGTVLVYGCMAVRWTKSSHDSWRYLDISASERDTPGRLALNGDLYLMKHPLAFQLDEQGRESVAQK